MISLFSAFLYLFGIVIIASIWWYLTIPSNLPPGPRGFPFFGSSFDTWKASNLHRKLHQWTTLYGNLYKFYVADKLVVVLGDWDMIQEALVKQGDLTAARPPLYIINPNEFQPGTGLVNSEGELWKTQRRFALSTLRDFGFGRPIIEPSIKDETEYLIEAIEAEKGRPFDPATLLNNGVSNVICALVFGRRFQYDDEDFKQLLKVIRMRLTETNISPLTPFVLSKRVATMMRNVPRIKALMTQGSNIARFSKREIAVTMKDFDLDHDEPTNYVQAFYKAQRTREDNWTFTDDQLLTSVSNLFIAGTDTTATTLRWAIFFLAQYPNVQEEIYEEIKTKTNGGQSLNYADRTKLPLTEAAIMESQRMANLVPLGVMRRTLGPMKLKGYDIPVDTVIVPLLTSVLRDSKTYPNPEVFDPKRFMNNQKGEKGDEFTHLIPFLAGKRICLGESLARMELFLFFTSLISAFKFTFSPDEPKPPLDGERVALIRGPIPFKICAVRRKDE